MNIIYKTWNLLLDAVFPVSIIEKGLRTLEPAQAYEIFPKAPPLPINNAWSVFAYKDERVSRLVWQIKYKRSSQATIIGGYALYQILTSLDSFDLNDQIVIVPMPISGRRRKERGFNQCELIAEEMKKLDANGRLLIKPELLSRVRHVNRQTLKNKAERLLGPKGVFFTDSKLTETFKEKTFIIIDDVITTGSTMNEAVETLKGAEIAKVYGLSLAH
ncbi:MAG: hypothetical protein A3D50_00095 [Candidatus Taylorbacteria bacterium RIFCSPHIGHO2_02_FULL_44_12]|uniref:Phosphoribosyltransferase domain-containing protein n=1 Tax=Candidatus Taylorbacteria bacterium RIFCSPHIGHO2_02_FULL_44_12 TaxID=1802308 RepID=A0A1G2MKZ5_9BACT|nr:MAG: hypothetical protein A3D50_00095 [Candidatus Taylorbacteria bacterium RIFCSPHIGHO2_02_FULL_44_12]